MRTLRSIHDPWKQVQSRSLAAILLVCAASMAGCGKREERMVDLKTSINSGAPELKFKFGTSTWELVMVPPGRCLMGAPPVESGRTDGEMPPEEVEITGAFYIGKYEITQAQYEAVMQENPSEFKGPNLAVDQIRYEKALEFCRRFSEITRVNVTLPTEAQWEYACRAGSTTRFHAGDAEADLDRVGWYRGNSGNTVHAVGQKEPNSWGIYDMHGNVYEPCIDYITSFEQLNRKDPEGKRYGTHGAGRGGAWMEPADRCRVGSRIQTDDMFGGMGIRIVINP